jgi:hypothetical protein
LFISPGSSVIFSFPPPVCWTEFVVIRLVLQSADLGQTLIASDFCTSLAFKSFSTWFYGSTVHTWECDIFGSEPQVQGSWNRIARRAACRFCCREIQIHSPVWRVHSDVFCRVDCMVLLPENMHAVKNTLVLHPQEHNNNLDAVCHTRKAGDATARPAGLMLELSRTTTTSPAPSSSRSCATAHSVTCFTRMTALISSPFWCHFPVLHHQLMLLVLL